MNKKKLLLLFVKFGFGWIILLFFLMFFLLQTKFVVVKPGEKAVMFHKFTTGLDKEKIYSEGTYFVTPWNSLTVYDVTEQTFVFDKNSYQGKIDVLEKNGLLIEVEAVLKFYPVHNKIGELHEQFGSSYINKLVVPEARSAVRKVMGRYTVEEIFINKKQEVEEQISSELQTVLLLNNIELTVFMIKSLTTSQKTQNYLDSLQNKKAQTDK